MIAPALGGVVVKSMYAFTEPEAGVVNVSNLG